MAQDIGKELNMNLLKVVLKWKKKTEKNMISILKQKGKGNSKLIKNLKIKVTAKDGNITLETDFPDYAIFVDHGRKPGKQPPLKSIEKWCKSKGIKEEAAFPIARSIGKKGIKPTNFMNPLRAFGDVIRELQVEIKNTATNLLLEQK